MTTKTEKCCRNCRYAEWKKDTISRNNYGASGKCTFRIEMPMLPVSAFLGWNGDEYRNKIKEWKEGRWYPIFSGTGKECKCFEPKEKKP